MQHKHDQVRHEKYIRVPCLFWSLTDLFTSRYEDYLKRLAGHAKEVFLVTSSEWLNGLPWMSRVLGYGWGFTLDKVEYDGRVYFDLFSRKYPTLFEIELQEAFDKLWLEENVVPGAEGAKVFLRAWLGQHQKFENREFAKL